MAEGYSEENGGRKVTGQIARATQLPPEVQAFATAMRERFGPKVRLLFAADQTGSRGNPANDQPEDAKWTPGSNVIDRGLR